MCHIVLEGWSSDTEREQQTRAFGVLSGLCAEYLSCCQGCVQSTCLLFVGDALYHVAPSLDNAASVFPGLRGSRDVKLQRASVCFRPARRDPNPCILAALSNRVGLMGHATHTLRHRDGTVQLHVHFPSLFQQKPLEIQEENLMEKPLLLRYHTEVERCFHQFSGRLG